MQIICTTPSIVVIAEGSTDLSVITPQRVAGALKRAGMDAAKSTTTSVRGWHDRTEGFRTSRVFDNPEQISVTYHTGGHRYMPVRQLEQLTRMKDILLKEGFLVTLIVDSHPSLVVQLPKSGSDATTNS